MKSLLNNDNYDFLVVLVVIIGFIFGYLIISYIFKKLNNQIISEEKQGDENKETGQQEEKQRNESYGYSDKQEEESYKDKNNMGSNRSHIGIEEIYWKIMGLEFGVSPSEIKKQYRNLLSKYHPDKVSHLGQEFQEIAADKTKTINEAYDYFRRKYNVL
jgi:hypothetical protein